VVTPDSDRDKLDAPLNQFLAPDLVLLEMAEVGAQRAVQRTVPEVIVLSMLAGGFITIGALFATLIAPVRATRVSSACWRGSASPPGSSSWCCPVRCCSPR